MRAANVAGRWRRGVESCVVGHHAVEANRDAFNDSEEDGTRYSAVAHGAVPATDSEGAAGEEAGDDGVPRVLLLPNALDGTVICVEEAAPDTEVAAENRGAGLDGGDSAYSSLAVG